MSTETAIKVISIYLLSFPLQSLIGYYLLFFYKRSPIAFKMSKKVKIIASVFYWIIMAWGTIMFTLYVLDLNSIVIFENLFHY